MTKLSANYLKAYALLGKDKATGELFGYVENSFSMGLSKREVRRWPIKAYYAKFDVELSRSDIREQAKYQAQVLAGLEKDKKKLELAYPGLEFFIVRLNSKKCPIVVDWKKFHAAEGKYDRRNVTFKKKV